MKSTSCPGTCSGLAWLSNTPSIPALFFNTLKLQAQVYAGNVAMCFPMSSPFTWELTIFFLYTLLLLQLPEYRLCEFHSIDSNFIGKDARVKTCSCLLVLFKNVIGR